MEMFRRLRRDAEGWNVDGLGLAHWLPLLRVMNYR